jgi:hypothetical protein
MRAGTHGHWHRRPIGTAIAVVIAQHQHIALLAPAGLCT